MTVYQHWSGQPELGGCLCRNRDTKPLQVHKDLLHTNDLSPVCLDWLEVHHSLYLQIIHIHILLHKTLLAVSAVCIFTLLQPHVPNHTLWMAQMTTGLRFAHI